MDTPMVAWDRGGVVDREAAMLGMEFGAGSVCTHSSNRWDTQ